ncbi:hypothetical protein GOACH_10_00780 [Gordonia aichiensis NBRC 108223]|uniref:Uncharacterized protein n=2 Tax=Gordonia aichiensis TaxID=36820 RepID=L7KJR7_9ACTN|nr:hypothetical protein GOACH_10_00780 [Gordonia aichiensis NBRC 108223]
MDNLWSAALLWTATVTRQAITLSVQRMGRRNHKSPKPTVGGHTRNSTTGSGRQYHAATRRRLNRIPWAAAGVPDLRVALVDAFRGIAEEWAGHILPTGARMLDAMDRADRHRNGLLELTDEEYVDLAEEYCDAVDLYTLLRGLLGRADTSAEVLTRVSPIWVPEAITESASTDDVANIGVLGELGSAGLLVFEKPLTRMTEGPLPNGIVTPTVDVDAVLWWSHAEFADIGVGGACTEEDTAGCTSFEVQPLTRSRDLQGLRGDAWRLSVLTEVTNYSVDPTDDMSSAKSGRPLFEMLGKLGVALEHGAIRVSEESGTPTMRFDDAA